MRDLLNSTLTRLAAGGALCGALAGAPFLAGQAAAEPDPPGPGSALGRPLRAEGVDARDYNQAGRGLLARLGAFKHALEDGHFEPLAPLCTPDARAGGLAWRALPHASPLVDAREALPAGALPGGPAALLALLREPFSRIEEVEFKSDLLEEVRPEALVARLRVRIVGDRGEGRLSLDASLLSRWRRTPAGLLLESLELRGGEAVGGSGRAFSDQAIPSGVLSIGTVDPRFLPPCDTLRYQVVRHAIGGASAVDMDGDGKDDLLLTQGDGLRLFLNRSDPIQGLRFVEGTQAWGLSGVAHPNVCLGLDFDGDGDTDLFVGSFYGPNHLFENTGSTLRDVSAASGLAQDDMTAVAAAADFDGDGRLDLYLGRFLDARTEVPATMLYTRNGAPNRLYRGLGGLRFEDVSAASGADDRGLTLGVAAGDIDGDGDVDLYLSNDYGRNVFLENTGQGRFRDAAPTNGTLAVSGGMSASLGDLDGDGLLDLYVSSIRSNQRWFSEDVNVRSYVLGIVRSQRRKGLQELFWDLRKHMGESWAEVGRATLKGNYFLRQRPDRTFEDRSEASGAAPAGWFWSSGLADLDNEGTLDVIAVDGWITGKLKDDL